MFCRNVILAYKLAPSKHAVSIILFCRKHFCSCTSHILACIISCEWEDVLRSLFYKGICLENNVDFATVEYVYFSLRM